MTHWVMDYETLTNCFIAVFQHYKDDSVKHLFVIHKDRNDLPKFIAFLNTCVAQKQYHISYNGIAFDAQISQTILDNQKRLLQLSTDAVIKYIYDYAQKIITTSDRGEFPDYPLYKLKIRQ